MFARRWRFAGLPVPREVAQSDARRRRVPTARWTGRGTRPGGPPGAPPRGYPVPGRTRTPAHGAARVGAVCVSAPTRPPGDATTEARPRRFTTEDPPLFEAIAIVLLILWLIGLVTSTMFGGLIHVLFIVAVLLIVLAYVNGRGSRGST